MPDRSFPRPTEAELELLRVLWERGPCTVREIHEALGGQRDTVYTTTLKILQKMTAKGLLRRNEAQRSHVYEAVCEAEQTQRQLVRDLIRRAFGGAARKLVVQALSEEDVSPEDLAEIRRLVSDMEKRRTGKGKK